MTPGSEIILREAPLANIEAEQSLLAALLARNNAWDVVSDVLRPEHFADPSHGEIFTAISRLVEKGEKADALSLPAFFSDRENAVELRTYISELQQSYVSLLSDGIRSYAGIIKDVAERREMIAALEETLDRLRNSVVYETHAGAEREALESKLAQVSAGLDAGEGLVPIERGLGRWLNQVTHARQNPDAPVGISSGLTGLDGILGGWQAPDLIVVAARTGMFKTAIAIHYALAAARAGHPVAFFSLEMGDEQLAGRLLAQEARINHERQRRGQVSNEEMERLIDAERTIKALPLEVDQTPNLTIGAIRSRARRFKRKMGGRLGLVVVDYLQLMVGGKAENRVQEVAQITRGLKLLAKDLNVPVIALSQLNRTLENREDKRPMLSDLRESGSIEQDADVVLFNFYEHTYVKRERPKHKQNEDYNDYGNRLNAWERRLDEMRNRFEIMVAKNRHGAGGEVVVRIEPDIQRFSDLDGDAQTTPRRWF